MAFMPWNEDFVTGVTEIDRQHRWLVNLTNALYETLNNLDDQAPPIGETLERLVDYTVNHFVLEEELFQRLGYPETKAHKAEHDAFTKKVVDLLLRHEAGEEVTEDTAKLLKGWLTHHILKVDKAYVSFFAERKDQLELPTQS